MAIDLAELAQEVLQDDDFGSIAEIAGAAIPGVYQAQHVSPYEAGGYGPMLTCAGRRVSGGAKVRDSEGTEVTVAVGASVTTIRDHLGNDTGAFTVRAIMPNGSGLVRLQLEEV